MSCFLLFARQSVFAQDKGEPALKNLAVYTAFGSVGGVALGLAVFLLDPLAESADFELSFYTGMTIGAVGGFIFGWMQLSRQMIVPYEAPQIMMDNNEFGINHYPNSKKPEMDYAAALESKPLKGIPLVGFNYKF
jgi:hypothetical protein